MKTGFKPPVVKIGDIVHFYHGKSTANDPQAVPMPAVVTGVNHEGMLDLAIIPKDSPAFHFLESAVRHKDDPLAQRDLDNDPDGGVWVVRPDVLTADEAFRLRVLLDLWKGDIDQELEKRRKAADFVAAAKKKAAEELKKLEAAAA